MKLNNLTDHMAVHVYDHGKVDIRKMMIMFYDFIGKLPHEFPIEEVSHTMGKAVENWEYNHQPNKEV